MRNGLYWNEEDVNGVMVKMPHINLADGYDAASQYFFAVPGIVQEELKGIDNKKPTKEEVDEAMDFIDFFLCDFTFLNESAKASAIAFMLTMLCREIIDGSIPMLEVRAAESQSGKTLLVKMTLIGLTGEKPSMFTPNFRDTSEFEKEYFSKLLSGRNYVFMDNVTTKVQAALLDMALTTGFVDKRLLSTNKMGTAYAGMPHVMTANNPSMSEDMRNRVYLLDILKPDEGKQFIHTHPEAFALESGPKLLRSLITLYNNWVYNHEKKPFTKRRIDGFIEWSLVIGGILQAVGMDYFLDDTMKQIKETDPAKEQAASMARKWYDERKDAWLYIKEMFEYAINAGYVKADDSEMSKIQTISNKLKKLRMVKLPGGYRFEKDDDEQRGSRWRVVRNAGNDG